MNSLEEEKIGYQVGFCRSSKLYSENQKKRNDRKVQGSCSSAEKAVEYESYCDTYYNWCAWNSLQNPR